MTYFTIAVMVLLAVLVVVGLFKGWFKSPMVSAVERAIEARAEFLAIRRSIPCPVRKSNVKPSYLTRTKNDDLTRDRTTMNFNLRMF